MQTNGSVSGSEPKGLPPVEPPSGRFLAQMFVIPALIVAVLVALIVGVWMMRAQFPRDDSPDATPLMRDLESSNPEIWWRGAYDLAQVLKRPESLLLASRPRFALDLADKLQQELKQLQEEERATQQRVQNLSKQEQDSAWEALTKHREQVHFLVSALGDFTVPVGAPLLGEIALEKDGPEPKSSARQRHLAVWSLANMGQKMKRYQELSQEQQSKIVQELAEESSRPGSRGAWAKSTHAYLTNKTPLGVDATLEACAGSEDRNLRSLVAMALTFWEGPRVEPTLEKLSHDDGHGTRIEITPTK